MARLKRATSKRNAILLDLNDIDELLLSLKSDVEVKKYRLDHLYGTGKVLPKPGARKPKPRNPKAKTK